MPIIQAKTIDGRIIENASWSVNTLSNIGKDHLIKLAIDLDKEDQNLRTFIARKGGVHCIVERKGPKKSDGSYCVATFQVTDFTHMLDTETSELSSMCYVVPINRTIEGIMTYKYDRKKCDARFEMLIKNM